MEAASDPLKISSTFYDIVLPCLHSSWTLTNSDQTFDSHHCHRCAWKCSDQKTSLFPSCTIPGTRACYQVSTFGIKLIIVYIIPITRIRTPHGENDFIYSVIFQIFTEAFISLISSFIQLPFRYRNNLIIRIFTSDFIEVSFGTFRSVFVYQN